MNDKQLKELLLQSLEQEVGGVQVYETALKCVINEDLREEWERYLKQTRNHEQIMRKLCAQLGIDAEEDTPGRIIVRAMGQSLVEAMEQAREEAEDDEAAELVACECVVVAETKDHADWELISKCGENAAGDVAKALKAAAKQVEDEEDEHLYHTKGWCRELWLQTLGIKAILPPPEETRHVKSAIEAARAEMSRH